MFSVHTEPNGWPYRYEQMPKIGHIVVAGDGRRGQVVAIEHRQPNVRIGRSDAATPECMATLVIEELARAK